MSLPCVITTCRLESNVLCHCCKQNLCRAHYNEHDYLNTQLNLLADEINAFDEQLTRVDAQKLLGDSRLQLDKWRADCHLTIDHYFEQKCRELDRHATKLVNTHRDKVSRIRTRMLELVEKREVTLDSIDALTSALRTVEHEVVGIDQKYLRVTTTPLTLDDSYIRIEEPSMENFDLPSLPSAFRKIDYSRPHREPLASNDQFLLIHKIPHICLLDRELQIIKQIVWNQGQILDMCWSSALASFFLITLNDIFLFGQTSMTLERVQATQKLNWLCCTCSDTSLFLSTNEVASSICEFSLLNSLQAAKRWESPDTCSDDECIDDIFCNKSTLALVIRGQTNGAMRMELRSATKFERIWLLKFDMKYNSRVLNCCLLSHDEWLIVDSNTSRLSHIARDGKIKSTCYYNPKPCCATLFSLDILAISTLNGVNFHRI